VGHAAKTVASAVAIVVLLSAPAGAKVAKRSGKRDFPAGLCPLNLGRDVSGTADPILGLTGGDGPGTFVAASGRAVIGLLSCDRLGFNDGLDLRIDNFRVVRWDAYRKYQVQYVDPDADPANPYKPDPNTCYSRPEDFFGIEEGTAKVRSVFDRGAVARNDKARVPFEDKFQGRPRSWLLMNAEIESDDTGNQWLVLARSQRPDGLGGFVPGDLCSAAIVEVGGLKKGAAYVVDFDWNVNFSTADTVLTVLVETAPRRTISLSASLAARLPSATANDTDEQP
jgi:hypothetical protein